MAKKSNNPHVQPEDGICESPGCPRTKSLWQTPTEQWFCWPHFSRIRKGKVAPYTGRKTHNIWAISVSREMHPTYLGRFDGGLDYDPREHLEHREWAIAVLKEIGLPVEDRFIQWLRTSSWVREVLEEEEV